MPLVKSNVIGVLHLSPSTSEAATDLQRDLAGLARSAHSTCNVDTLVHNQQRDLASLARSTCDRGAITSLTGAANESSRTATRVVSVDVFRLATSLNAEWKRLLRRLD